jgi:hypothetical protein
MVFNRGTLFCYDIHSSSFLIIVQVVVLVQVDDIVLVGFYFRCKLSSRVRHSWAGGING